MAIIELATSRTITYDQGNPVGIREFYCHPYDTEQAVLAEILAGSLPRKFDPWPVVGPLLTEPRVTIILRDYEVTRDPNVQKAWRVRCIYRDGTGERTTILKLQPNDDNYATYRLSTEGRFVDMWRQWTTDAQLRSVVLAKTDANYVPRYSVLDANADIGGTKIDVAGTPTSVIVPMQRLVVDITTIQFPALRFFRPFLGTRNKTVFLGCDVGTAVCLGADATEMQPSRWKISLSFEIDKYYHLKQVAIRNAAGYVELDQGGDTNALGRGQAARVAWVQPHPEMTEFKNIHPALPNMRSP